MFVCSLTYIACNAHAPYCRLWPAWLYNMFSHYLINGQIFGKLLLNIKCAVWFSLQLLFETFPILRWIHLLVIQQLHLKYLCNLARYWLQSPWGWHDSVETFRSVIICEIIVHWLVIVQNNTGCMVHIWYVVVSRFIVYVKTDYSCSLFLTKYRPM